MSPPGADLNTLKPCFWQVFQKVSIRPTQHNVGPPRQTNYNGSHGGLRSTLRATSCYALWNGSHNCSFTAALRSTQEMIRKCIDTQRCFIVGPSSSTSAQQKNNIGYGVHTGDCDRGFTILNLYGALSGPNPMLGEVRKKWKKGYIKGIVSHQNIPGNIFLRAGEAIYQPF